ncbi:MAG: Lar family restriction alleviation protein [Lysobacter sp.]
MRCRHCGCTDTQACPGGCWWSAPEVCSSCAARADAEPLLLNSCPFCDGPPVPIVQNDTPNGGAAPVQSDYGDEGLPARAFVFCHECGAEGPGADDVLFDAADYQSLEQQAVRLWQERNRRHRPLYDAGNEEGLNLYPRAPDPRVAEDA